MNILTTTTSNNKIRNCSMKLAIVVGILVCLVLVSGAAGFEDTVQNHWDMDGDGFGDVDDLTDLWLFSASGSIASIITPSGGYSYSSSIRMYAVGSNYPYANITNIKPTISDYWAFTFRDTDFTTSSHLYIYFYDKESNQIFISDDMRDYAVSYSNSRWELIYEGGNVYLYINGINRGNIGVCEATPYYMRIKANGYIWGAWDFHIDDITTSSGIIGIGAEPCSTGTFRNHTITELDNDELDISWAVKTIPEASYTAAEYTIKVKRLTYDEYYNTTIVKDAGNATQKPTGFVVYNWTKLFQTDHYGLYSFQLYKSTEEEPIATDWLFFKELGQASWIDFALTEYAIGSTVDISYHIDTPDFGANDYYVRIFDSSYEQVGEQEVFTEDGYVNFTSTITWDVGTAFAVLVKDTEPNIDMSPPTDIVDLAYAYTYMTDAVFIRGTCYDATNPLNLVDGTTLSNMSVSMYHNNQWYKDTTDANGYYEFLDPVTSEEMSFYTDVPIQVNAGGSSTYGTLTTTESFNTSDGEWIQLVNGSAIFAIPNEQVYNGTHNFTYGIDYVIDYSNVKIKRVSTGTMELNTSYTITYTYEYTSGSGVSITYQHNNYTTEIIRSGTYDINLYLYPSHRDSETRKSSIAGVVLDTPLYQPVSYATVHIANDTWSDTTLSNTWGYYIFDYPDGLGDSSYNLYATRTGFGRSPSESVRAHDAIHILDNCDVANFYNTTLDKCDSLTNNGYWGNASIFNDSFDSGTCNSSWVQLNHVDLRSSSETVTNITTTFVKDTDYKINYTDGKIQIICTGSMENDTNYNISYQYKIGNPNLVDTDFIEGTGALNSTGDNTIDFMKTFITPIDSKVSKVHGLLYFYSQILNKANISSTNITITIGSNGDNSINTIAWEVNKDVFETYWNMTALLLSEGTEVGTCNLSEINYFEWKSTKSGSVTTKIDDLHFIMWVGWDTNCLDLSADTTNKKEGTASIYGEGAGGSGYEDGYLAKYFLSPIDASDISKTGELSRIEFWEKPYITSLDYVLVSKKEEYNYTVDYENYSGGDYGYMYWDNVSVGTDWNLRRLYFVDAYDNNFTTDGLEWFEIMFGSQTFDSNYKRWIDNIQVVERGRTYHNILMSEYFSLTIDVKDLETYNIITSFSAVFNKIQSETTNGTIVFRNITYGIYRLQVSTEGYYTHTEYIFIGQDTSQTIYMLEEKEGPALQYPPHLVEFRVQDIYGNPISDVNVIAIGIQISMGSWDWLWEFLGFTPDGSDTLRNTTMNGTTDSTGSITFLMVETIKYTMTFTKGSDVNETLTIYPKEERYIVIVGRTGFFDVEPQLFGEQIKWNFTMEKNDTHAFLNFTYNNTISGTSSPGSYYVYTVNKTTGIEKLNLSNFTYCCGPVNIDDNVWNYSCPIHKDDYRGETYIMRFNVTHTTAGEFGESVSVFFRYNHPLISFAGWEDHPGYYQLLSVGLLIFGGLLFSGTTLKIGAVLLPLGGWILFGIGWFSPTDNLITGAILLGIATALGIAVFITTTGREKNLAS